MNGNEIMMENAIVMNSSKLLQLLSDKDIFPNPENIVYLLRHTSISDLRSRQTPYEDYKEGGGCIFAEAGRGCNDCCFSWRFHKIRGKDGSALLCTDIIIIHEFKEKIKDFNVLIDMKKLIDEYYGDIL